MKTKLGVVILVVTFLGTLGCRTDTTSPAKDVAVAWLTAVAHGDDTQMKFLTDPKYQGSAGALAEILRNHEDYEFGPKHLEKVRWTPSEIVGETHEWTAHTITLISIKLRDSGDGQWKVVEVDLI
jgi:hypothetical protein